MLVLLALFPGPEAAVRVLIAPWPWYLTALVLAVLAACGLLPLIGRSVHARSRVRRSRRGSGPAPM